MKGKTAVNPKIVTLNPKLQPRTPYPLPYRGYSILRTHTALGSYGKARPRGIGPAQGVVCVLIFE